MESIIMASTEISLIGKKTATPEEAAEAACFNMIPGWDTGRR